MPNPPNRSADRPARNPTPAEVRAAREAAGLTQAQAAVLVHASTRNWQQWEQEAGSNVRRMHPGLWELFQAKANEMGALKTITIYAAGWYSAAAGRCESGVFDGRIEFPQALHAPLFDLLCEEAMEHERFEPREKWMRAARGLGFKMEAFARSAGLSLPRGDWLISPMYDAAYVHWGMGVV